MNILIINGSPHPTGNSAYASDYALKRFQKGGAATQFISLHDRTIHPCVGCWQCTKGDCKFADDDMAGILETMCWCDALVLVSPVYMGLMTGQMKVMMDRSVPLRVRGSFQMSGKIGGGIACGGFRNGGQELTLQAMHTYFLQQDMLAVSDGPNFSHSGAAIVGKTAEDRVGLLTIDHLVDKILKECAVQRQ